MGSQIERIATNVAQTQWQQLPEAVVRHAKLVLLDTLGVMLAGSEEPDVRRLREGLQATAGTGATVLARGWPMSDPRSAALLNGIATRSIELCEGHRFVSCQAGAQVLPGVLAVGEAARASGRELLMALILGYDTAVRIGSGMKTRPLAHQNGQAAMLGAAAAGARLRALNAEQTSRAMRIAATLVLTPSYNNAVAGGTTLNVAGGMSGFAAALAPELALAGFVAQPDGIEEALGKLVGDGFDPAHIDDELGTRWEITRNRFRLRACCNPIYPALDALELAIAELAPRPDDVDRVEVATYRFASVMANPSPPNAFAAKYSLPQAAAALLVRGDLGLDSFDAAALQNPAIAALRQRVHVSEDPAMNAVTPKLTPARVTLRLKDGRSATHTADSQRGDFQNPYTEAELRGKFRELAARVLEPAGVTAVEQAVDAIDTWNDAGVLLDLLRRHGRR